MNQELIDLAVERGRLLEREAGLAPWIDAVAPARRASAANLAHYLAPVSYTHLDVYKRQLMGMGQ